MKKKEKKMAAKILMKNAKFAKEECHFKQPSIIFVVLIVLFLLCNTDIFHIMVGV